MQLDANTITFIVGTGTILVASITAIVILRQVIIARRVLEFQAYLAIENTLQHRSLMNGMKILRSLPQYTDYRTFIEKETPETQKILYDTVYFLNNIAHLVNDGHMNRSQAWSNYFLFFRECYDKLYPWYIQGLRNEIFNADKIAFLTLERMLVLVHEADNNRYIRQRLLRYQTKGLRLSFYDRLRGLSLWKSKR
jgi:hypothetical protein